MMSTFKDVLYKKEDNETWTEWNNRLPNDEDKLDYIGETIYIKICETDTEMAGKITELLRELGIELLLPLLDSNDLLEAKIKEGYEVLRLAEQRITSCDKDECEIYKKPLNNVKTITVAEMIEALSKLPPDAKLVMTESGYYSNLEFAEVMLPKLYTVENDRFLSKGSQVYIIGHSHTY